MIPSPSSSPSMEIQIMGGNVCLRFLGKTLLGVVNKIFVFKCLLTRPGNVAFTTQANFPANNLKFHWGWRWWDQIQAIFFTLLCCIYGKVPKNKMICITEAPALAPIWQWVTCHHSKINHRIWQYLKLVYICIIYIFTTKKYK